MHSKLEENQRLATVFMYDVNVMYMVMSVVLFVKGCDLIACQLCAGTELNQLRTSCTRNEISSVHHVPEWRVVHTWHHQATKRAGQNS